MSLPPHRPNENPAELQAGNPSGLWEHTRSAGNTAVNTGDPAAVSHHMLASHDQTIRANTERASIGGTLH